MAYISPLELLKTFLYGGSGSVVSTAEEGVVDGSVLHSVKHPSSWLRSVDCVILPSISSSFYDSASATVAALPPFRPCVNAMF